MRTLFLNTSHGLDAERIVGALAALGVKPSTFEWELGKAELGDYHFHYDRVQTEPPAVRFTMHPGLTHDAKPSESGLEGGPLTEEPNHPSLSPETVDRAIAESALSSFVKAHARSLLKRLPSTIDGQDESAPHIAAVLTCIGLEALGVGEINLYSESDAAGNRSTRPIAAAEAGADEALQDVPAAQDCHPSASISAFGAALLAEFAPGTPAAAFDSGAARTAYGLGPEEDEPTRLRVVLVERTGS